MKKFFAAIGRFFLPPADAKLFKRILPLFTIVILMLVLFVAATVAWEESNSVSFCGLTCHTMPPEYVSHSLSPHTNVTCEDCHMGRDKLGVLMGRKIRYSWQTGSAMITGSYEFPIIARNMAPAREACENCHKPELFSSDTLREIRRYSSDEANTPISTFLSIKTGGGSRRQGLGFGIHWHIENPVYFIATDDRQQNIPYVVVENADGTRTEYFDVEAGFDPGSVKSEDLIKMDCITCHNRTAHNFENPEDLMDSLMTRGLVSPEIPEIKLKGSEVLAAGYESEQAALDAIAGLGQYYQSQKADFYAANTELVNNAVTALQEAWKNNNFPKQEVTWQTHPDNLAHQFSPGCFRCHDGKHLTEDNKAVRLECNLCHSIPVVSSPSQLSASLTLGKGFEPESHKNPNWITLHRDIFDQTCAGCHTVEDPGGTSNTSFCSNSVCHGSSWEFAGFDAPKLREALLDQVKEFVTPTPIPDDIGVGDAPVTPTPEAAVPAGPITYESLSAMLKNRCGSCHGANAMKGLNVLTYADLMKGGESGPAVIPGDPDNSLLVQVQTGATKHFGQFTDQELEQVVQWIQEGAKEK